ncbi:hypothetical protein AB0F03_01575 [Streptomyces sp. NPDC028722]|uniref:hypothetical protein n=1 Tax=Streptomyces sp. NPDC028722 TaxID=3155016 RepID=UPI0033CC9C65
MSGDTQSAPGPVWPAPEQAYALAPNLIREIGWTARTARLAAGESFREEDAREYWLRKAAVLDRIALHGEADGIHDNDAAELADAAAAHLIDTDQARTPATDADPRGYVRQEYARWIRHH